MRKLILFAAVFLLLAAPAWAVDDTDTLDVQVTLGVCAYLDITSSTFELTIDGDDINQTYKTFGPIVYSWGANAGWDLFAEVTTYGYGTNGWGITIDGVALDITDPFDDSDLPNHDGSAGSDTGVDITGNKITGLAWGDTQGGPWTTSLLFTLTAT